MHQQSTDPATEVKQLQRCMNDLVSILALPAIWSVSEPRRILETLLAALMEILDLEFLYARVRLDARGTPINAVRTTPQFGTSRGCEQIRNALDQWSGEVSQNWSEQAFRDNAVSGFPIRMGIEGELGFIVAGSRRVRFPEQSETLILTVAANQAAIWLQQSLRLTEQKRLASELDQRVLDRTRELADANEELQLQLGVLQHIPVAAWTLDPDGTTDFVNQFWLDYIGDSPALAQSHPHSWMDAVHPE